MKCSVVPSFIDGYAICPLVAVRRHYNIYTLNHINSRVLSPHCMSSLKGIKHIQHFYTTVCLKFVVCNSHEFKLQLLTISPLTQCICNSVSSQFSQALNCVIQSIFKGRSLLIVSDSDQTSLTPNSSKMSTIWGCGETTG